MPGKHHLRGFKIAKKIGSPLRGSWTMLPLGKKLDLPLACEVKMYFFLSCYCRAEKYWFPQQNTDFWVWEYWKAQIQLGSSVYVRHSIARLHYVLVYVCTFICVCVHVCVCVCLCVCNCLHFCGQILTIIMICQFNYCIPHIFLRFWTKLGNSRGLNFMILWCFHSYE